MLALITFIVLTFFISDIKEDQEAYDRKIQIQKDYIQSSNTSQ